MKNSGRMVMLLIMVVLISLWFLGCKDWDYDVEHNGIHFKKIYQSDGGTRVGYMSEDNVIQGFPCARGWIHFRRDWRVLSCQLSTDFDFNGCRLPAETWIHFSSNEDRTGYVCSFPNDFEVQGYLCGGSGGYKGTHTGFYESGRLRSFFAPEDVEVCGVPCEASLLQNVNLYEDGAIKSCKLAREFTQNGKTFRRGKTIEFAPDGTVVTPE